MNQNSYRTNNNKTLLLIAIISFAIPFSIHLWYKTNQTQKIVYSEPDPGYAFELQLMQKLDALIAQPQQINTASINQLLETNNVKWLNSPVTQEWIYHRDEDLWKTERSYDKSLRSNPSLRLGLRDDGVVVWEKINVR